MAQVIHYIPVPAEAIGGQGFVYSAEEPCIAVQFYQNGSVAFFQTPVGKGYHPLYLNAPAAGYVPLRTGEKSGVFRPYDKNGLIAAFIGQGQMPPNVTFEAFRPMPLPTSLLLGQFLVVYGDYAYVGFDNGAMGVIRYNADGNGWQRIAERLTGGITWQSLLDVGAYFTPND